MDERSGGGIGERLARLRRRRGLTQEELPNAPKLVHVQVADDITARVEAGELRPGAKLPAERDLAGEYGVAYDTIRRATALLRERGLIITIVGRGTYVAERD